MKIFFLPHYEKAYCLRFLLAQIPARFLLQHFDLIDEHSRVRQVRLELLTIGPGKLTEEHGGLLGLHHDQFDEPLGHLAGVGGLLDFWHGVFLSWLRVWDPCLEAA